VYSLELGSEHARLTLATPEAAPDLAQQLPLITGALTPQGIAFDITD